MRQIIPFFELESQIRRIHLQHFVDHRTIVTKIRDTILIAVESENFKRKNLNLTESNNKVKAIIFVTKTKTFLSRRNRKEKVGKKYTVETNTIEVIRKSLQTIFSESKKNKK